jgi:DNA polymerase elongation subunit (family B)
MLQEILDTRIMVKRAMKKTDDELLYKILDARQFSLKMLSNVMYGILLYFKKDILV